MSKAWSKEVDRFCHQYLQVEPSLDFPSQEFLRLSEVQDALYARLFADGAVRYGPPARYQTKILKELVAKVEASIDDWDQYYTVKSSRYTRPGRSCLGAAKMLCHVSPLSSACLRGARA
ncbi:hypothetical protein V2G26_002964 [Clonostachys chloroleuca]